MHAPLSSLLLLRPYRGLALALLPALLLMTLAALPVLAEEPTIRYVDAEATGGGNGGSSWANAYTHLQDALDQANANGSTDYEIWVAEGVYYPDEESVGSDHTNDSESEYFTLSYNNVRLYGGFVATETERSQRDWAANVTILSGDTDHETNPDTTTATGVITATAKISGSNADHILYLDGQTHAVTASATVIDGFTITAGQATNSNGGELYCADSGSGKECSPSLTNVSFSGNTATDDGGGMYSGPLPLGVSRLNLVSVILRGNAAGSGGAQVSNDSATPVFSHSLVEGGISGLGTDGGNNLAADPLFVDAANGDLRLPAGSPAINAGTNSGCPATDLNGAARVDRQGDIGAYEAAPRLTLVKGVDEASPDPGQRLTYSLHLTNSGNRTATGVVISDTLPAGLTFAGPVSLSSGSGDVAHNASDLPSLVSNLSLDPGQIITVTLPVTVNTGLSGGLVITNSAAVTAAEVSDWATAAVTATVNSVAPVISNSDPAAVTMSEDGAPTPFSLTLTASDGNGDSLTWSIASPASHGTAVAAGTGASKAIGYTPTADYSGSDSFIVEVSDGSLTDTVTVNVTVENTNDAPRLVEEGEWEQVGSAGFSAGQASSTSLALDSSGTPYVAYMDYGHGYKASVMKFDGSSWVQVGSAGFSPGTAEYTNLALDSSDTPYVAYRDWGNSQKASVMKFDGSSWEQVGSAGFSAGMASYPSLALDSSGTPYVAYVDYGHSGKASVMTFNGSSWEQVGSAGFSAGSAYDPSLALDSSDTPYVAYRDWGHSGKASVMTFDGSSWEQVGSAGFSAGRADFTSLALDSSSTPYVAYMDYGNSQKASVMKFDGSSWEQVGSAGFSAGEAWYTSLALDSSGTPYVAYKDYGHSSKASVMKFDGSSWVQVGSAGFSAGVASYPSLALDSSGTPYVAYMDYGHSNKASVMTLSDENDLAQASVTMSEDGDPTPFALTLTASDADGDELTWSIDSPAGHGTAVISASFVTSATLAYTPTADYNGSDSFIVQVSDGSLTDTVTVNVTVQAQPDAPVISEGDNESVTMSEDGAPTPFSLTLTASDADGDELTWSNRQPVVPRHSGGCGHGGIQSHRLHPHRRVQRQRQLHRPGL